MQDLVTAFESQFADQQFSAASATLQQLLSDFPDDPQLQILKGRLYDATGRTDEAEAIFRRLLKAQLPAKLITQARQGLLAIEMAEVNARQARIDELLKLAGGSSFAYLALLPVLPEQKDWAIAKIARVFRTDPYTARFKIPNRYPKIICLGTLAEMQAYGEELQSYGLGVIWLSIEAIAQIPVYQVEYFGEPQINPKTGQKVRAIAGIDEIIFTPDDVIAKVEGILPTFGEIVVVNAKHKLARKEQILDRVQICDLHLRNYSVNGKIGDRGILRFHDNQYRFELGLQLPVLRSLQHIAPTVKEHWTELSTWLTRILPNAKTAKDFQNFAEMSIVYPEFLKAIEATHINLERPKPSLWDNAFQLYSSTVFYQPSLATQITAQSADVKPK
jgi:tetratricopeptide (TPR) repeat protein